PFFSVNAQIIQVNGADVQVFEYPSATRADSDSAKVSPTGSPIGQSQISWMDTPNFYKRDRLVVLYVGHSVDVMKPLEAILGPPFAAGRLWPPVAGFCTWCPALAGSSIRIAARLVD